MQFVGLLCMLYVRISSAAAGSEITANSNDTWAISNHKVVLQCCITTPSYFLRWLLNEDLLYNGMVVLPEYRAEYTVNEKNESNGHKCSKLINHQIQLNRSGTYKCKGYNEQRTAQLDVLGTPLCNATYEGIWSIGGENNITLHCSVEYSGNLNPLFKWKENGEFLPDANREGTEGSSRSVSYSLIVTRSQPSTFEAFLFINAKPEHIVEWQYPIPFKNNTPIRDSQISLKLTLLIVGILLSVLVFLSIFIIYKHIKRNKKSPFALKIGDTQPPGDGTNDGLIYNSSDKSEKGGGAEMVAKSNEVDS